MSYRLLGAALLFVSLVACSSRTDVPHDAIERLAILPIENLTTDASLDWISAASTAVLSYDLTGPKHLYAARAPSIRDARLLRANRILEGYFAPAKDSLSFHLTIRDPAKQSTVRTIVISARSTDLAGAMDRLAKTLSPNARYFSTHNAEALRLYGEALRDQDRFDAAAHADSRFTSAYLAWAQRLLSQQDTAGAQRVAAEALSSNPSVDIIDRAELRYISTNAAGDSTARFEALQTLANELPSDPQVAQTLGELQLARRQFADAVRSLHRATQIDPGNAEIWNTLGYTRACAHDLAGAREALLEYQKLLPQGDANAEDSLGEVSYYLGDFAAAERHFTAAQLKDPDSQNGRELLKAAQARMMTGDLSGADKLAAQYDRLQKQRRPAVAALDTARWLFITGRRKNAMSQAAAIAQNAEAQLQLGLWRAQTGQAPVPAAIDSAGPLGRAIRLLLTGEDASPVLAPLFQQANPLSDSDIRALLAWSEFRSRPADAAKLADRYPIPLGGGDTLVASLVFPRFLLVRGTLLHSERDMKLWKQYEGDLPDAPAR